jgi:hypothetical protein
MSASVDPSQPARSRLIHQKPPPFFGLMTREKLEAFIAAGHGQGHFTNYKPWLLVTKKVNSPRSRMSIIPCPDQNRLMHFRSRAEKHLCLLLRWLGAVDVREQFPMWPWRHQHPGVGLPGWPDVKMAGLLDIAHEAGIEHGRFAGTSIPYIATLDVLATWRLGDSRYSLSAYECKPAAVLNTGSTFDRTKQRLYLGHCYCNQAVIPRHLVHAERFPRSLFDSLDALNPKKSISEITLLRRTTMYLKLVEACETRAYQEPAAGTVLAFAKANAIPPHEAISTLHIAVWNQDLDHNLELPLELFHPLRPGGRAIREKYMRLWGPQA